MIMERCLYETKNGLEVRPCKFFNFFGPSQVMRYKCTRTRDGKSYCYNFDNPGNSEMIIVNRSGIPDDPIDDYEPVVTMHEGKTVLLQKKWAEKYGTTMNDAYLCVSHLTGHHEFNACYDTILNETVLFDG